MRLFLLLHELVKHSYIVFKQEAYIVDLIAKQGGPVYTHAEGIS